MSDTNGEAYQELTELAGGFIHEMKNHLGTLTLNLQLLGEDFEEPRDQRERRAKDRVTRLRGECQRLVELSNEFLRFARIRDLDLEPSRLGEIIGELLDFVAPTAEQADITVHRYVSPDLPEVSLNPELFKQALLNLILNAEQAMPDGGELTLQASVVGDEVCLHVIDTGEGIPAEMMPKLFKPFRSGKPDGNGLGLITTRRIVQAHGGRIEVQSEPGNGTRFAIYLPAGGVSPPTSG